MAASTKPDPALTNPLLRLKLRTRLEMSMKWIFALPEERRGCYTLSRCGGAFTFSSYIPFKYPTISIYIRKPCFHDAYMTLFQRFQGLRSADLGDTCVTEQGIACLSGCRNLQGLALWGTDVTDGLVDVMKSFAPLYVLTLSGTKLSIDAINEISTMFPSTYIFHREYGDRFRGLVGQDAMRAWTSDDEQCVAPKTRK